MGLEYELAHFLNGQLHRSKISHSSAFSRLKCCQAQSNVIQARSKYRRVVRTLKTLRLTRTDIGEKRSKHGRQKEVDLGSEV